jgi:hypothetical protein
VVFNDFINDDSVSFQKVMVKSCQVLHPCLSPDPVALETKEQTLGREQNEPRAVDVVKSMEKKKNVVGQFAVKYKSETYCTHSYRNGADR